MEKPGALMLTMRVTSRINVSTLLPQAERARVIAGAARDERDALIQSGRASSSYRTLVDGRDGAAEESIKPGGVIIYRFNTLGQAAVFGLAYAVARSPRVSGDYRRAWVVVANGKEWRGDLNDIPPFAEVLIVNSAPYHRKITTGGQRTIGRGVVEATRQELLRRYPNLTASVAFLDLSGVIGGFKTPYVLKGAARSQAVVHSAKRKMAGTQTVAVRRKDSKAGLAVTYPAVVISARVGRA